MKKNNGKLKKLRAHFEETKFMSLLKFWLFCNVSLVRTNYIFETKMWLKWKLT